MLKPCPHCGGAAQLYSYYSRRKRLWCVVGKCILCGSQGKAFFADEDPDEITPEESPRKYAIEAWNMRFEA